MMFGLDSFNLINEFERASNEPNAKQLASSSAWLQPYRLSCRWADIVSCPLFANVIKNNKTSLVMHIIICLPNTK